MPRSGVRGKTHLVLSVVLVPSADKNMLVGFFNAADLIRRGLGQLKLTKVIARGKKDDNYYLGQVRDILERRRKKPYRFQGHGKNDAGETVGGWTFEVKLAE